VIWDMTKILVRQLCLKQQWYSFRITESKTMVEQLTWTQNALIT